MIKHYRVLLLSLVGLIATSAAHAEQFSVLLFSKAAGWHHESIHEGVTAIRDLGKLHDFTVFWTEDARSAPMPPPLPPAYSPSPWRPKSITQA